MDMNTLERISIIKTYFDTRRGAGHTAALVDGISRAKDVIFLVSTKRYADSFHGRLGKNVRVSPVSDLDILRGSFSALVIDNSALVELLGDALAELGILRRENFELREAIKKIERE